MEPETNSFKKRLNILLSLTIMLSGVTLWAIWFWDGRPDRLWSIPIIVPLGGIFLGQFNYVISGREIFWIKISIMDKLLYIICTAILLIGCAFPVMLHASAINTILSFSLCLGISLVLMLRLGGDTVKQSFVGRRCVNSPR